MKQYQVYGLGNALVDIDVSVEEALLRHLSIDKGVMTLVDEQRHHQLVQHFESFEKKHSCGGSAANTMIAFAQLGGTGYYSCKVADDLTGELFVTDLLRHGVDTNLQQQVRKPGVTGKCIVLVTPDAQRTMLTHLGITESLSVAEVDDAALKQAEYVYLEGYLVASASGRQAAIYARELAESNDIKTSLTLSDPNMVQFFKSGLLEMIGNKVDLLFCNEEEAMLFANHSNLREVLACLSQYARHVIVTRGEKGAIFCNGGAIHEIATKPVEALDTVGAGDVFAGAYLYGITHGSRPVEAIHLAHRAAAEIVTIHGARLRDAQLKRLSATETALA